MVTRGHVPRQAERNAETGAVTPNTYPALCIQLFVPSSALLLPWRCEKFFTVGETIGLEEEAEQHRAVGRDCLMLITGGAPDELARPAFALVILKRALDHVSLFECSVLVQRYDGTRFELKQSRGDAGIVGIEHLDFYARKLGCLPGHIGHVQIMCRALRRIFWFDVGVNDLGGLHGHSGLLGFSQRTQVFKHTARNAESKVPTEGH